MRAVSREHRAIRGSSKRSCCIQVKTRSAKVYRHGFDAVWLLQEGEVDELRFTDWVKDALGPTETRISRIKGIVAMQGVDARPLKSEDSSSQARPLCEAMHRPPVDRRFPRAWAFWIGALSACNVGRSDPSGFMSMGATQTYQASYSKRFTFSTVPPAPMVCTSTRLPLPW